MLHAAALTPYLHPNTGRADNRLYAHELSISQRLSSSPLLSATYSRNAMVSPEEKIRETPSIARVYEATKRRSKRAGGRRWRSMNNMRKQKGGRRGHRTTGRLSEHSRQRPSINVNGTQEGIWYGQPHPVIPCLHVGQYTLLFRPDVPGWALPPPAHYTTWTTSSSLVPTEYRKT